MKIEKYIFGEIVIDGKIYRNDVIIYPDRIFSPWWRKEGHRVCEDDIKDVFKCDPDVIIIGTGASGFVDVPQKLIDLIKQKKIELIIEPTSEAVKSYNEIYKSKKVVACLHLTC